mgnify:CR=1 FL=1
MKTKEEIESLIQEYLIELKNEKVNQDRFGFEISTYLKSLASMDRNPIAADLAKDTNEIARLISQSTKKTDARRDSAIDRINQKYGLNLDADTTAAKYLVHFSGRNTGTVVHATSRSGAISRARAKKVTGWEGAVDAARLCNDRELGMIKKGTWIRTRANGKETGGAYKFRSWMKK